MGLLIRAYASIFELAVSLFLIGLALLALSGDASQLRLPLLPWEGVHLAWGSLLLGILGLAAVLIAVTGIFRAALPLWALVVLILLIRGWFLSSYSFATPSAFYSAAGVTGAALLAFLCSFAIFRKKSA